MAFAFDGRTYQPIKGTPKGPPLSYVIAEAVLNLEERHADALFVVIGKGKVNMPWHPVNSEFPDI